MKSIISKIECKESLPRHSWADLCRVLAILGVILIHACGATFYQFGKIPLPDWLAANFLDSLVRCAVPLFVMLSGALLLKADSKPITVFQVFRRVSKLALPLFTWNIGYLLYVTHFTGESVKWASMLTQAPMYHLWFVYMIIGIYILLPVLQAIFQLVVYQRTLQIYLLAIWLIVTCVPVYQPITLLSLLQQTSLFGYGGYFLIGGVITASRSDKFSSEFWWLVYLISASVTFVLTLYFSQRSQAVVETAYLYFSPNVFVASVAAFILISRAKVGGRFGILLQWISDRCFLIFFIHVVILERISSATLALLPGVPSYLSIAIATLGTFFISLMIAAALRLLPASKMILG
jgi:surface polysaccharide O-acyltransferase-like enzyme